MYNFDEIIDRRHTNAMNTDGFRDYIFHADESMVFPYKDEEFIRMWVADMEFATPDVVIDGIRERLDKRIFGYTRVFENSYYEAFAAWCRRRYGWEFSKRELVMSNGVIPALFELVEYICAPDERVLFLTPSYAYFKYAADHSRREYVCSDLINTDGYYTCLLYTSRLSREADMEFRAFLKGKEQSGATALLIRALSDLRVISGGWALVELERADGSRVKGLVEPCQAATAVLPFDVAGAADTDSAARFGRVLAEIREKDMGWLDPVLGPELADADCAGQLGQLLGEDLPLVGTIAPRELAGDAEAYERMLAALEADEGTLILDLDELSEAEAAARLREWAETVLDWAHHKKFDPLMKLRGKRRRTGLGGV